MQSNVCNVFYSDENGAILHVIAYYIELYVYFCIFSMIMFIVFKRVIIKLIKVCYLVFLSKI